MIDDSARALLLACLHEDAGQLDGIDCAALSDASWEAFVRLAAVQCVRPLVLQRLLQRVPQETVPEHVLKTLHRASRATALRNLRLQAELGAIAGALRTENIPLIVLKGAYLGPEVYGSSALREMSDIDILVRREHLQRAVDVVLARGYEPVRPFSVDLDAAVGHHVTRLLKHGAWLEVHWRLTIPRQEYSIDLNGLWERAVAVHTCNGGMFALSTEDLILHLCHHASYLHRFEFGLRPFCDIAATIRRFQHTIDWCEVERRCAEWRWGRGVQLALCLAKDLVGAAVPETSLTALRADYPNAAIISDARAQVFANVAKRAEMNAGFSRLGGTGSVWSKVRHVNKQVFHARSQLGATHVVDPDSPTLVFFYLVRLLSLLRRHSRNAMRLLWRREPATVLMAERKVRLADWLLEP